MNGNFTRGVKTNYLEKDITFEKNGARFGPKAAGIVQTEDERGLKLWHRWQPLDSLRELDIKPTFLYDVLPEFPDVPNYIIHRDNP